MVRFECTVQEGCVDDDVRPAFEQALTSVCHEVLGAQNGPVEVSWTVVKKGYGFRGGEPSRTSMVRGRIPDGCDGETRARLLRSIGNAWCRMTGATEDELVVAARDESWRG